MDRDVGATEASLQADDDVLFCGWSMKRGAIFGSYARYFALRRDASLTWYEEVGRGEELKFSGRLELSDLSAIKREKPDSTADFTFRLVTHSSSVRLDPGSKQAYDQWQEGLMVAVSAPSPL